MCCDVVGCVSVGAAVASAVRGCGRLPSPAVDGGARSGFGRLCCMRLVVSGSCGSSVGVGGGAGEGAGSRGSTDCAPILEGWLLVGGVLGQPVWLVLAEPVSTEAGRRSGCCCVEEVAAVVGAGPLLSCLCLWRCRAYCVGVLGSRTWGRRGTSWLWHGRPLRCLGVVGSVADVGGVRPRWLRKWVALLARRRRMPCGAVPVVCSILIHQP